MSNQRGSHPERFITSEADEFDFLAPDEEGDALDEQLWEESRRLTDLVELAERSCGLPLQMKEEIAVLLESVELSEARVDAILLEAGFSGRRKDSLGRSRCYQGGKPVPCHGEQGGGGDRAHSVASERLRRLIDTPGAATPRDVQKAADALMRITKEEAKQLQAKYGLKAKGTKAVQAKAIAEQAAKAVDVREQYARKARAGGLDEKHFFHAADQAYNHATEWREQVRGMLAEARGIYKDRTGKALTNIHPAFRGGDSTQIEGFELIARTMAGRYPGLLGQSFEQGGDSTENAEKLYDFMYAGVPQYTKQDAYEEALAIASPKQPRRRKAPDEEAIPF